MGWINLAFLLLDILILIYLLIYDPQSALFFLFMNIIIITFWQVSKNR